MDKGKKTAMKGKKKFRLSSRVFTGVPKKMASRVVKDHHREEGERFDEESLARLQFVEFVDEPSEILSYFIETYYLNPHETDCFSAEEDYVLARRFERRCRNQSEISIMFMSEEDVTLPSYITTYELNAHNTDCFTEAEEYVGAIQFQKRMKTVMDIISKRIDKINNVEQIQERFAGFMDYMTFSETLIAINKAGAEVGEVSIEVNQKTYEDQHCLKVVVDSNAMVSGNPCSMKMTGYVTPMLDTLEFECNEFLPVGDGYTKNKIRMTKVNDEYVVKHTLTKEFTTSRRTLYFTDKNMENFVSDAACLLLQRFFVLDWKQEEYHFVTLDADCNLCSVLYERKDPTTQIVAGKTIEVFGLKKSLLYRHKLPLQDSVYLNQNGYILSLHQHGMPVVFKSSTIIDWDNSEKYRKLVAKKELDWQEDWELVSKFLTRKDQLVADYSTYVAHHPQLKAIIVDFLQAVLLKKPGDVLSFAAEYFIPFKANSKFAPQRKRVVKSKEGRRLSAQPQFTMSTIDQQQRGRRDYEL